MNRRYFRLWRLRLGCYGFRFGKYRRWGRLVTTRASQLLLVKPLLDSSDPPATLFGVRRGFTSLSRRWSYLGRRFLRFFKIDGYSSWRSSRSRSVVENFEPFGQSSTLRPVNRVEAEIVALMRIGARLNEEPDEICVTINDRENKRGTAAAACL